MAIDHLPNRPADTAPAGPADLDVPDFLKPGFEPAKTAAPDATNRPAPRTTHTAAMTVARTSGRGLGTATGWLGTGIKGGTAAGWRYARAHDRIESIDPSTAGEWEYIAGVRRRRWITCACTAGGTIVGNLGAWLGMVAGVGMTAVPGLLVAPSAEAVAAAVAATVYGRHLTRRAAAELEAAEQHPAIGVPLEGEVVTGGEALLAALTAIKVPDGSRVVDYVPGPDGTSITIVDLPANFTVTSLRGKAEELAGALGRDTTMVDIQKAGHANQAAIWLSSSDPFEAPRPSPLMNLHAPLDTWRAGVPVAWGKRGDPVFLPITNANFLIAGMTRSGKGVGAANLAVGAAFDPWINLRLVAGKSNGEWDPAAKAGVAATYFKPDPHRLLALLDALLEDKDRRERELGKVGKSKLVPGAISTLGGVELLILDEVATYTRPGLPLRDEILERLIKLSAVAAGAGILMVLITQYPEADVIPQALAMNCGTRWAMRVDNAQQSNAVLGGGASGSGRDASKFDPPRPGLGWLVNPFAGVTDLARSYDLDEDDRGEVTMLMERAARFRDAAGRLVGQWDDPIEQALAERTGLSSAAGGPQRNGVPGRVLHLLDPQQAAAHEALTDCVEVMDRFGVDRMRTEALLAALVDHDPGAYGGMTTDGLKALLAEAGAGKPVTLGNVDGMVNPRGFKRDALTAAARP